MPFTKFAANAAWLELVLAGADLLAWLRVACLDGELARAEPKALRYRLLHVGARLVRRARRIILRLPKHWPWADELADALLRSAPELARTSDLQSTHGLDERAPTAPIGSHPTCR